jgi:hypothetical protein
VERVIDTVRYLWGIESIVTMGVVREQFTEFGDAFFDLLRHIS